MFANGIKCNKGKKFISTLNHRYYNQITKCFHYFSKEIPFKMFPKFIKTINSALIKLNDTVSYSTSQIMFAITTFAKDTSQTFFLIPKENAPLIIISYFLFFIFTFSLNKDTAILVHYYYYFKNYPVLKMKNKNQNILR